MNAYLVLGAESTGTRFMTRVLISAGCHGFGGFEPQQWDTEQPTVSPIVWRRSFPHADYWPDIPFMMQKLAGYEVKAAVMVRDGYCMQQSQRRFRTETEIKRNTQEAYRRIFTGLITCDIPYIMVAYGALARHYEPFARWLLGELGLPTDKPLPPLEDGDGKYYAV